MKTLLEWALSSINDNLNLKGTLEELEIISIIEDNITENLEKILEFYVLSFGFKKYHKMVNQFLDLEIKENLNQEVIIMQP